jgi:hypothetical protein
MNAGTVVSGAVGARLVPLFCALLIAGCAPIQRAPGLAPEVAAPREAPAVAAPSGSSASVEPGGTSAAPPPALAQAPMAAREPVVAEAQVARAAPVQPSPRAQAGPGVVPSAPAAVKAPAAPMAAAPAAKTQAPALAKPAGPPPLDIKSLEARLKETKAIGIFTKLTLKNQVDDLLERFREFYRGQLKTSLASLRQSYDLLVLKVLALLQDTDPSLAGAIAASRESMWSMLSNPDKFSAIK